MIIYLLLFSSFATVRAKNNVLQRLDDIRKNEVKTLVPPLVKLLQETIQTNSFDNIIFLYEEESYLAAQVIANTRPKDGYLSVTRTIISYTVILEEIDAAQMTKQSSNQCSSFETTEHSKTLSKISNYVRNINQRFLYVIIPSIPHWYDVSRTWDMYRVLMRSLRIFDPSSPILIINPLPLHMMNSKWVLQSFANTYLFAPEGFPVYAYDLYQTCFYCKKRSTLDMQLINYWTPYIGFKNPLH